MNEEEIRPKKLIEENRKLNAEEFKAIVLRKDEFVSINCPACESNKNTPMFNKRGFDFVTCINCDTVFINPRPSINMLEEFYANAESRKLWNEKIFPATEDSRRKHIFYPRAQKVIELSKKFNIGKETLMDVGAGFGTFCQEIMKMDYFREVIAVEPSSGLADTCRKKGIEVVEDMIENVKINNVSVITNFELIEHLFWPKDFLNACNQALPRGGFIMITTPNIKGFDLSVLGKESNSIGGPGHLNYFHPDSLALLLESCGFKTIEVLTPGQLDAELVRKKVLDGEFDISRQEFLKKVLIEQWDTLGARFQEFLVQNQLFSHMWFVANKI
ncbi:MAG: class I SAM-dependent methyltransferase [Candidatus Omnitrophica bacterium]|nr:class I SAM-dependent methyltransferase [Candidatus Omnitrophota bacterium]